MPCEHGEGEGGGTAKRKERAAAMVGRIVGCRAQRVSKRTAMQDRHAADDELPALGLYEPCAGTEVWGSIGREKEGVELPRGGRLARFSALGPANAPPRS